MCIQKSLNHTPYFHNFQLYFQALVKSDLKDKNKLSFHFHSREIERQQFSRQTNKRRITSKRSKIHFQTFALSAPRPTPWIIGHVHQLWKNFLSIANIPSLSLALLCSNCAHFNIHFNILRAPKEHKMAIVCP